MNEQEKIKELSLLKDILRRKEELMVKNFDSNFLILITNKFTMRVLARALDFYENKVYNKFEMFGMPFIVLEDSKFSSFNSNSDLFLQPYFEIHPIIKE
tara:strand:+ start:3569 stop:3865 length:297 start_codon:yes stop_codon:yes gene_type:complete